MTEFGYAFLDFAAMCLIWVFIFLISYPFHEFGHVLMLKIFKVETELTIDPLYIRVLGGVLEIGAHVEGKGGWFQFPEAILKKYSPRLIVGLIGFSGGGGSVVGLIFLNLLIYKFFNAAWPFFKMPIFVVASFQFFYCFIEMFRVLKTFKTNGNRV